jgi:hypothetical protein
MWQLIIEKQASTKHRFSYVPTNTTERYLRGSVSKDPKLVAGSGISLLCPDSSPEDCALGLK